MSEKLTNLQQMREALLETNAQIARVASAAANAIEEVAAAIEKLQQDITDGTIAVKTVFPVVDADPANPQDGEAWIKK